MTKRNDTQWMYEENEAYDEEYDEFDDEPDDPCSDIYFSEEDGYRYLHFGSPWIQGGMRIRKPDELVLEYPRQMMACGLFYPEPKHILQLGLGAASLTKFCYRYTEAKVDVVEISSSVIAAAYQWFKCPDEDERLTIHHADAKAFIGNRRTYEPADWLQVDLYDAAARGPVYDDVAFYTLCRRALNKNGGVASFNLFGSVFSPSYEAIHEAFEGRTLMLPEMDEGNRIVLAFGGKKCPLDMTELYDRAGQLRAHWNLPAQKWLAGFKSMNSLGDFI